jgi:hypothetical protein
VGRPVAWAGMPRRRAELPPSHAARSRCIADKWGCIVTKYRYRWSPQARIEQELHVYGVKRDGRLVPENGGGKDG